MKKYTAEEVWNEWVDWSTNKARSDDSWKTFVELHPQFKEWFDLAIPLNNKYKFEKCLKIVEPSINTKLGRVLR